MHLSKKLLAAPFMVAALSIGATAPASAQIQQGLVNVFIGEATVQVPIGIAAAVCPVVNAAVLAQDIRQRGEAQCRADAEAVAQNETFQRFAARQGVDLDL